MSPCLTASVLLVTGLASSSGDPSGWKRIDVPEAGFSAAFPGLPIRAQVPMQLAGRSTRTRTFVVDRGDVRWALLVNEPGDTLSKDDIRRMPEGLVAFLPDVTRKVPARRQAASGVEVEQQRPQGRILSLYLATDDRVYTVAVWAKRGELPDQARAFLDGFRLIPVQSAPPPVPTPVAAWKEYAPKGARFAARFPAPPVEEPGELGDGTPTRAFAADQDGVRFTVLVMPIPPDIGMTGPQIATALAEEKRAEMDRLGGPVRLGKPGTTSRFPSRDLSGEKEGASVFMRVVVGPKTVYQLGVVAVGVSPEPGRSRFVDSFRVLAR